MRLLALLLAIMPVTLTAQVLPADWSIPNTGELICKALPGQNSLPADMAFIESIPELGLVVAVPINGQTLESCYTELVLSGEWEWVEPNYITEIDQCDMSNTGDDWQAPDQASLGLDNCDALPATTWGAGIKVAVCDTGWESHDEMPDSQQLEGYNAGSRLWESEGGNTEPQHPHGVQVTGCVRARVGGLPSSNGIRPRGIAPGAQTAIFDVSNSAGGSSNLTTLAHAVAVAADNGFNIITISYSGGYTNTMRDAGTYAWNKGAIVVMSAGNDNVNRDIGDKDADNIVYVGALANSVANTNALQKAGFSAYGNTVDIFALGQSYPTANWNGTYTRVSGTSFSAPAIAGALAAIWSQFPNNTNSQVLTFLKEKTTRLPAATSNPQRFGYGMFSLSQFYSNLNDPPPPPVDPKVVVELKPTLELNPVTGNYNLETEVRIVSSPEPVVGLSVIVGGPLIEGAIWEGFSDFYYATGLSHQGQGGLSIGSGFRYKMQLYPDLNAGSFAPLPAGLLARLGVEYPPSAFPPPGTSFTSEGFQTTEGLNIGPVVSVAEAVGESFATYPVEYLTPAMVIDGVPYLRGDANMDGNHSLADALMIMSWMFSTGILADPPCLAAYDCNADNTLNISDVLASLNVNFFITELPAPFNTCGYEFSGLDCEASNCQ